jgi:hypothetical protein
MGLIMVSTYSAMRLSATVENDGLAHPSESSIGSGHKTLHPSPGMPNQLQTGCIERNNT